MSSHARQSERGKVTLARPPSMTTATSSRHNRHRSILMTMLMRLLLNGQYDKTVHDDVSLPSDNMVSCSSSTRISQKSVWMYSAWASTCLDHSSTKIWFSPGVLLRQLRWFSVWERLWVITHRMQPDNGTRSQLIIDEDIETLWKHTKKQLQKVHRGLVADFDSDAEDYRADKPVPDDKYTTRFK